MCRHLTIIDQTPIRIIPKMTLPIFRPGTCDSNVWRAIVELNEYRLPDRFDPGDLVIDIGGHIGSFSRACLDRGAGEVLVFEASRENFERLCRNLCLRPSDAPGGEWSWQRCENGQAVVAQRWAVWRSDRERSAALFFGGFAYDADAGEINTGGGRVFQVGDDADDVLPSTSLRDILASVPESRRVRLLKLDCEGSEWPILYTLPAECRLSDRVDEVIGEWHVGLDPSGVDSWRWSATREGLEAFLRHHGYDDIQFQSHRPDESLGVFWASRSLAG